MQELLLHETTVMLYKYLLFLGVIYYKIVAISGILSRQAVVSSTKACAQLLHYQSNQAHWAVRTCHCVRLAAPDS